MQPEIRTLPDQTAYCVMRKGAVDGNFTKAAQEAFTVLMQFVEEHQLGEHTTGWLGISDSPRINPDEAKFYACCTFDKALEIEPSGEVETILLPGGKVAVFMHIGSYTQLGKTWATIYNDWLPTSGLTVRKSPPYELYLDGDDVPEEKIRTEIHIPLV